MHYREAELRQEQEEYDEIIEEHDLKDAHAEAAEAAAEGEVCIALSSIEHA